MRKIWKKEVQAVKKIEEVMENMTEVKIKIKEIGVVAQIQVEAVAGKMTGTEVEEMMIGKRMIKKKIEIVIKEKKAEIMIKKEREDILCHLRSLLGLGNVKYR